MSSTPEKREIDAKKYIAMKLARIDGPVVLSSKELEQLGMILNPDTWSISAISTAEKWIGGGSQLSGKDSLQTIAAMNGVRAALGAASRRRLGTAPRRRIGDGEPDQSEE